MGKVNSKKKVGLVSLINPLGSKTLKNSGLKFFREKIKLFDLYY